MDHVRVYFPRSGITFIAEVSEKPHDLRRGLMGRLLPQPMLFIFPYAARWPMTMFGMLSALDFVFLDDQRRVIETASIPMGDREPIIPNRAARYVLEIRAGVLNLSALRMNDEMIFQRNRPI